MYGIVVLVVVCACKFDTTNLFVCICTVGPAKCSIGPSAMGAIYYYY